MNLNNWVRRGIVQPGWITGPTVLSWNSDYWGEPERATISSDMRDQYEAWVRIQTDSANQHISLRPRPRHYGGVQWFFVCPVSGRDASVLWRPPGGHRFCSRQAWGKSVAYISQCLSKTDRAHWTMDKIKRRLIADLDPDEWHFPPKPKWMRWRTYRRYEEWFDRWDAWLDGEIHIAAGRLLRVL